MVHTAELHTAITPGEYHTLIKRQDVRWERDFDGNTHCHIRTLEPYGITDIRPKQTKTRDNGSYFYCIVIINLQRIVNNGKRSTGTYISERDFSTLSNNFSLFISPIVPLRTDINAWSLYRIDYNIDLKLNPQDVNQYITLLQRGDKNYSWHIHEFAEEKKRRQKSKHGYRKKKHPEGSVLFDNKQYSVNIYNKQLERLKNQEKRRITDTAELTSSAGILRIEIQVKSQKLNSIKRNKKHGFVFSGKPIEYFARYDIAIPIIIGALENISGRTDYTTFERAKECISQCVKSKRTQKAAIDFLELVTHTKSLWRAKELYQGDVSLETVIKHLKRLNINPVTIPVSFKRDRMNNLACIAELHLEKERERSDAPQRQ